MAYAQRRLFGLLAAGSLAAAGLATPATTMAAGSLITVTIEYDGSAAGDGLCSLREAIVSANANTGNTNNDCTDGQSGGPDQIQVKFPAGGRINLASNLPSITDPAGLSIEGFGNVVVDGQNSYTPFSILGGSLTLSELVVQNGFGTSGGAVTNGGSATIIRSTIRSSSAFDGGGISQQRIDDHHRVDDRGQRSHAGGRRHLQRGLDHPRERDLAGNRAGVDAALSQSAGESTLRHVTVSLNVSDNGVVHRNGGTMDIFNSIVAGNSDGETSGGRASRQPRAGDPSGCSIPVGSRTTADPPGRSGWSGARTPPWASAPSTRAATSGSWTSAGSRGPAAPPPGVMPAPCSATERAREDPQPEHGAA